MDSRSYDYRILLRDKSHEMNDDDIRCPVCNAMLGKIEGDASMGRVSSLSTVIRSMARYRVRERLKWCYRKEL